MESDGIMEHAPGVGACAPVWVISLPAVSLPLGHSPPPRPPGWLSSQASSHPHAHTSLEIAATLCSQWGPGHEHREAQGHHTHFMASRAGIRRGLALPWAGGHMARSVGDWQGPASHPLPIQVLSASRTEVLTPWGHPWEEQTAFLTPQLQVTQQPVDVHRASVGPWASARVCTLTSSIPGPQRAQY